MPKALLIAAVAAVPLAGCAPVITAIGDYPGESCDAPASLGKLENAYSYRREWKAQSDPPVLLPELVEIRAVETLPGSGAEGYHHCRTTALFADGSEGAVNSSWPVGQTPNWVSAPRFSVCHEIEGQACGRVLPPALRDQ